jgi:type IV fimbrial biogenesis protein FimT
MNRGKGFTLIELMVVVALVAIGTMIAVPSFTSMIRRNQAAAETNQLVSVLNLARSEAIKRGVSVSICPRNEDGDDCSTTDHWKVGWIVFEDSGTLGSYAASDDTILQVSPPLSPTTEKLNLDSTHNAITFAASGFLSPEQFPPGTSANPPAVFDFQMKHCSHDENRNITINLQGRVTVEHQVCN